MIRALVIGTCVLLVAITVSFILGDFRVVIQYAGAFGVLCLLLSWVFTGSMGSGDRVRANYVNYTYEDSEDRKRRRRWAETLFFVGLPNVAGALLFIFWCNN